MKIEHYWSISTPDKVLWCSKLVESVAVTILQLKKEEISEQCSV